MQLLPQTKRALLDSARRRYAEKWKKKFGITASVLGPDKGMENEIRVLNRTFLGRIRASRTSQANASKNTARPSKSVQRRSNPVGIPAAPENLLALHERDNSKYMDKHDASRHVALSARLNYLSLDRPDLQFAAKQASRHMATPRVSSWALLMRTSVRAQFKPSDGKLPRQW